VQRPPERKLKVLELDNLPITSPEFFPNENSKKAWSYPRER